MPRFHFNAHRGDEVVADLEGEILADIETSRKEAIAIAREMLANSLRCDADPPDYIEVTGSLGEKLLSIDLASLVPKRFKT